MINRSGAAGLNVAEHVTLAAQEYDAVAGGIRFVPFEFVVRNFDFRSEVDVGPAARFVGPIIGTLILAPLPSLMLQYYSMKDIIYGLLIIAVTVLMPAGIYGAFLRRTWPRRSAAQRAVTTHPAANSGIISPNV